jgi:hypothetical protein
VLCAGSTLLLVQSYALDKAPYNLSGAVAKPASINLWKLVISPTSSINLGFILREDFLLCSSYLPLWVPNWVPNTHYQAIFLASLPGKKRISARAVSHFQYFYFVIVLLTLFLLAYFYQKYKKNSFFYSWYFVTFSSLCCSLSTLWRTFQ